MYEEHRKRPTVALKPCPFCGINLTNNGMGVIWYHPMTECILSKMGLTPDRYEVWNKRTCDCGKEMK